MSEDYLHACQRAELLGDVIPNEEEWLASRKDIDNEINEVDNSADVLQDLDQSDESMQRIGGGLDELNSILSVTQKKINRFKTVCGSLGQLLKGKMTPRSGTPDNQQESTEPNNEFRDLQANETCDDATTLKASNDQTEVQKRDDNETKTLSSVKKHELNNKIGSHIDKLDSLITKAENAQYSMQHQTKQMKTILKK